MQNNGINFGSYEFELMQDAQLLLTKRRVIEKVEKLWAVFYARLPENHFSHIEEALKFEFQPPKISKGENYKGLPYVVLDGPKYFGNEGIFTCRSLFWWGNFYSFSILVRGDLWQQLKSSGTSLLFPENHVFPANTFLSLGASPWEHDLEDDDVVAVSHRKWPEVFALAQPHEFLKVTLKVDLTQNTDEVIGKGLKFYLLQ